MDFLKVARGHWDRVLAGVALALGALLLLLGWIGVSGNSLPAEQMPYLVSAGLGGLLCVAVGATLWLSADLSDEWRKLDDIHSELKAIRAGEDHGSNGTAKTVANPEDAKGTAPARNRRSAKVRDTGSA
jgi:hypothetical protein